MSQGKQWSLETREFTSMYMPVLLHMIVIFQSVHTWKLYQFLLCFVAFRTHKSVQHVVSVNDWIFSFSIFRNSLSLLGDNIECRQEAGFSRCCMNEKDSSCRLSYILFSASHPLCTAVETAGLASSLALLLLISARHRERQKERAFSGRS